MTHKEQKQIRQMLRVERVRESYRRLFALSKDLNAARDDARKIAAQIMGVLDVSDLDDWRIYQIEEYLGLAIAHFHSLPTPIPHLGIL